MPRRRPPAARPATGHRGRQRASARAASPISPLPTKGPTHDHQPTPTTAPRGPMRLAGARALVLSGKPTDDGNRVLLRIGAHKFSASPGEAIALATETVAAADELEPHNRPRSHGNVTGNEAQ